MSLIAASKMRLPVSSALAVGLGLASGCGGAYAIASLRGAQQEAVANHWLISWPFDDAAENPLTQAAIAQNLVKNGGPLDYALFVAKQDGDGVPLTGGAHYTLRFSKDALPPVDGFWSVTMLSPSGALVQNPIYRSAIGSQTPDLIYGSDGSLDIFIQNEPPPQGASNWLPAPSTGFMLVLRAYGPNGAILNHIWSPPSLRLMMSAA